MRRYPTALSAGPLPPLQAARYDTKVIDGVLRIASVLLLVAVVGCCASTPAAREQEPLVPAAQADPHPPTVPASAQLEQHLAELASPETRDHAEAWFLTQDAAALDFLAAHAERDGAARAIGRIGRAKDVPLLEALVMDAKYDDASWNAAMALAIHPAPDAIESLRRLLASAQTRAAGNAVAAIGKRRAEALRPDVERMLRHADPAIRRRAVLAISSMGVGSSADVLRAAVATEKDPDVREALDAVLTP